MAQIAPPIPPIISGGGPGYIGGDVGYIPMQGGGQVQAEPLPYSEFEPAIGMQHPFGISMHFPTLGGGYSRPLRYQAGGLVQSPYLPRSKVTLTKEEAAFCREHGIKFSDFARHKLQTASL
jgi:hypothetical protein